MSRSRLSRCATEAKISAGDLAQRVEQEVHRPVGLRRRRTPGRPSIATRSADPPGRGQLAARLQRPLRDQREQHPLDHARRPAAARRRPGGSPRRSRAAPTPGPASTPRPAGGSPAPRPPPPRRGGDRLLRGQEPRDRGHQPGQRVPVHRLGPAEVVDHLRRRGPRSPGAARCAPAAGRTPPTRPGSSAASPAGTCPPVKPRIRDHSRATRPKSCAYTISWFARPREPHTSTNARHTPRMPTSCGSPA